MNILNINSYYYSSTVHKQLQDKLIDQDIESLTYVPLSKGYVPRRECDYGMEKHIKRIECYNKIDRYIFHIKHKKILKNVVKIKEFNLNNISCLHAHSLFSNGYIAFKLNQKYHIPYIVTVRDTDLNTFFKYMFHLRSLGVDILKNASKIIFLSKPYKQSLINDYIPNEIKSEIYQKSEVIPNGINDFWLQNKGNIKKINTNKKLNLLHVGEISKRKNLKTTLKAIKILKERGYNVLLTVVGKVKDKNLFDEMKKLPYINYISYVPKEELIDIYNENDIFIMPSITETFGLVYAEAMSQGLPIIYTKNQGFDGQFTQGSVGYSVNCFKEEEITNKVIKIIKNYQEISFNCLQYSDDFNWEKIANEYISIYNGI